MPLVDTDEVRGKILALATPMLEKAGVELVELTVGRYGNDLMVRFAADTPTGGITIAQCSSLNHAIVEAIDADGFLAVEGYALEFASPGLDRPLATMADFKRNLNRKVRVELSEPVEGKKGQEGILAAIEDGALVLTKKNKQVIVPVGQITKAMLVI